MVDGGKTRILSVVITFLTVGLIAVTAVFVYREVRVEKKDTELTKNTVKSHFPGLFRSLEEQAFYEQAFYTRFYDERKEVVNKTVRENQNCSFECFTVRQRRKRQVQAVEHGCCLSNVFFSTPATKQNLNGVTRILLQFDDAYQFFAVHTCSVITGCTGCTCSQEASIQVAVVWKDNGEEPEDIDDVELDYFLFDGCCKCINF